MLQFFKKSGRKTTNIKSFVSNHPDESDHFVNTRCTENCIFDITLQEAEKVCQEKATSSVWMEEQHQSFSKNLQHILTDKNYLSYFIQFLESKKALPLIKFWLDAESFKTAAEQCNQTNVNNLVKRHLKIEHNEWLHQISQSDHCIKLNMELRKSKSSDIASDQVSDQYDCDSFSLSKSLINKDACNNNDRDDGDSEQNDVKNISNQSDFDSGTDIHKLCDMDKPLTDDEKSQLCEQNILKQQQQQFIGNLKVHKESQIEQESELIPNTNINNSNNNIIIGKNNKHKNLESTLAAYAIRIFNKYLTSKSQSFIDIPATILSAISLAFCSTDSTNNIDNQSVATIFVEAQLYVLERMETIYLGPFIESSFYCKYCIDILTGENLKIQDILYCESLLFYFMEFLEQENARQYLDFWMAATNFKKLLTDVTEATTNQQTKNDALILYDKYFSLQATSSLQLSDTIRYQVEEKICTTENGAITKCFDFPLNVIETYLDRKYFHNFRTSNLFYKYLSELLRKIDGKTPTSIDRQNSINKIVLPKSNVTRHKKSYSDCSIERQFQFHYSSSYCSSSAISRSASTKSKPTSTVDMHIESKQLYNPDLLWTRTTSTMNGLQFGRVDALGRYERDFELNPCSSVRSYTTKSNKFKEAVKKWVNLSEDKVQEEIAWQVAEMIVKDITNVTMNCKQTNRTNT